MMEKTKNKNVTISITEEVRLRGLEVSQKLFSIGKLSATIAYLINKEHENLFKWKD